VPDDETQGPTGTGYSISALSRGRGPLEEHLSSIEWIQPFTAALARALASVSDDKKKEVNKAARDLESSVDWKRFAYEHKLTAKLITDIEVATDLMTLDKQPG
jgi:hypothetical protein